MTTQTIQRRIARGVELKQILATLEAELKQIKADLTDEAGGWSWRHLDEEGNQVCVTQPAPKLKAKLDPEAAAFAKIKEVAGRSFMRLFMQVPAYKPVEDFKVTALAHLSQPDAKKLIKLVTSESASTVSFEVAQREAA
jgi:hypothetical protein